MLIKLIIKILENVQNLATITGSSIKSELEYNIVSAKTYGYEGSWNNYSSSVSGFTGSWFLGGRYYFTDNFAGLLELGYGIAYLNIGVALKL